MKKRGYTNPPVKEVICEFRFKNEGEWDSTIPGIIYEKIKDRYPQKRQGRELEFGISNEKVEQSFRISDRLRLTNEQENIVVQIGPNHLVVNLLTFYTSWEEYSSIIFDLFQVYKEVAKPADIERVILRYVNKIDIPDKYFENGGTLELEDHFEVYPTLGSSIKQDYSSFITGVQLLHNEDKDILRLQMEGSGNTIFLEFAYFNDESSSVNKENLQSWLDNAHDSIIETFEATIKDSLRKQFGEVT